MRAVIQRVEKASVTVEGEPPEMISRGLLVLLAVAADDRAEDVAFLKKKILQLRIFEDEQDKMNRCVTEVGGEIMIVSQFTLYGDCRKGNRPSYSRAAPAEQAQKLYEELVRQVRQEGVTVRTGKFQAMMKVTLVNDGPVTIVVDSKKEFY